MTVEEALQQSSSIVKRREAIILLSHVTGYSATEILTHGEWLLSEPITAALETALDKRKKQMPLQYITGKWPFMGLDFIVDERVLIPRPDTEVLVELALDCIQKTHAAHVLDLCAGSGCIGIALAHYTSVRVTAAEISANALALAKENAALNGVLEKMCFIQTDLFNELRNETSSYDIIVSNPPYIPTEEIQQLEDEVKCYEPHLALDGGADGLAIYRRLIPQSVTYVRPGGALFLEVGPAAGVGRLMQEAGYQSVITAQDYTGLDRVVYGYRAER